MKGRALIDIPHLGARCGEFVELPDAVGAACVADGSVDPRAEIPDGIVPRCIVSAEEEAAKKAAEEEAAKKAAEEEAALLQSQAGPAETAEAASGETAAVTRKPKAR